MGTGQGRVFSEERWHSSGLVKGASWGALTILRTVLARLSYRGAPGAEGSWKNVTGCPVYVFWGRKDSEEGAQKSGMESAKDSARAASCPPAR
ncbi:hypothetical protein Pssp01_32990 [Pseudomonas sp. NBRC 100443]|nr:hypothetical protein Pssp01_32990 [Pseudomonas sp. NBRC 100443]